MTKVAALTLGLILVLGLPAAGQTAITGKASVIDGDTLDIRGARIRLLGIDAPEGRQVCTRSNGAVWQCGDASSQALERYLGQAPVRCEPTGHDRFNRTLATCFKGTEDINGWMVANGWAVAFRRYSLAYVAAEDRARVAKSGLWSGTFQMPWDWRAAKRR